VPRLTYALNTGIWLDNDIDLYEMMYKEFIRLCPSEQLEWNDETRKVFKKFHMNGYFDKETLLSAHLKRQISKHTEYKKDDWKDLDYVMKSYRYSIINTVGELKYDSEIFFHESCIYMDVLFEILKTGCSVWQQYDCWYVDNELVANSIKEIVQNKVIKYVNKYTNQSTNNNTTIVEQFADNVETLAEEALNIGDNNYGKDHRAETCFKGTLLCSKRQSN
jgi:hypothetical protein